MSDTMEFETAAEAFFEQMRRARAAGKDWWVDLQIRQVERTIWQNKKIAALAEALMVIRDADKDAKSDGEAGAMLPVPPMVLAKIEAALALVDMEVDPDAVSFATPKEN